MYRDYIYVCLVLLPNITAVYYHGTLPEAHNEIADAKQHASNSDIKTNTENHELENCGSKCDTKHIVKMKSDKKSERRLYEVLYSENKGNTDDKKLEQEKCAEETVFKNRRNKYSKTCNKKIDDQVDILTKKNDSKENDSPKSCKKRDTKLDEPDKIVDGESALKESVKGDEKKSKKPKETKSDEISSPGQECPKEELPIKEDEKKCKKPKEPKSDKISSPGQECPNQELPKPCLVSPSEKAEIANACYKKELICDNVYGASELSYDRAGQRLFFAFTATNPSLSRRAYYDIKHETIVQIPGVYKSKATAVDDKTGVVYFGSSDGLYEYNSKNNNATCLGFKRFNIKKLAMGHCVMCMIAGCRRKIYTVQPEIDYVHKVYIARRVGHWEDVQQIEIDPKKRLHITVRDLGLFCLDKNGKSILNSDLTDVDLLVSDGVNMFGIVAREMWLLDCTRGTAKKYAELDFEPQSMIFSENDLFISTCNKIYYLRRCEPC